MSEPKLTPADVNEIEHPSVIIRFDHKTYGQLYGRVMWDFSTPTLWRVRQADVVPPDKETGTMLIIPRPDNPSFLVKPEFCEILYAGAGAPIPNLVDKPPENKL
jgi:hypothetical protein